MISAAALLLLAQVATASPAAPAAASPTPRPTPSGPVVVLETSLGRIKIGLYDDKSPVSTENFLKYVRKGHYNGTLFHRVIPTFMIQGGGMTSDMNEKPTDAPIRNEARNGVRNNRGTVAMARTNDPNSATAQFFINLKDNVSLDFGIRGAGYAVFGEVVEGMDVVDKIAAVPTTRRGQNDDVPITPVLINSARVEGGGTARPATARPASPRPSPRVTAKPPARPRNLATPRPAASPSPKG
jgi:cyclophilin family peptidyl-prolyl cis-trans isomerase